ncbi:MAG: hypothetical protein E6R04_06315 [Spirochaetes bacterium]|nr:MAG: hypothetical protein E6R04_06315 [Spirochaetota bacterium]
MHSSKTDPAKSIQLAYRQTFKGEVPKEVLADLRVFCHATKTTAGRSESMERLEGRREVFLRIMTFLKVDIEDVYDYELDF